VRCSVRVLRRDKGPDDGANEPRQHVDDKARQIHSRQFGALRWRGLSRENTKGR
jgi:hypothetical protein